MHFLKQFSFACLSLWTLSGLAQEIEKPMDFAHEIVPLFKAHCIKCHVGENKSGGLSLNTREDLFAGGESGTAIVAGKPEKSELWKRLVATDESIRMPAEASALSKEEIAKIEAWIRNGAPGKQASRFNVPHTNLP